MCDCTSYVMELYYIKSYYTIDGSCLFILRVAQIVTPLGSLQLVPVTRIDNFFRNNPGSTDTRGIGNVSDVGRAGRFFTEPTQERNGVRRDGNLTLERGPGRWTSTNRLMANWVPPRGEGGEEDTSPVAVLEDTVFRMQRHLEELQSENWFLRTPRATRPVPLVRQATLTTTKVPWFNGSTSWEQYLEVFDAIVLSNGWGDATAALPSYCRIYRMML